MTFTPDRDEAWQLLTEHTKGESQHIASVIGFTRESADALGLRGSP
jgi:hypothetical protein